MIYNNGNEYDGEWLAGMRHGLGKLVEPAAGTTYEGEFVRNEKEGKGVLINVDGDIYEGTFAEGKPNGRGTYIWADGAKYIGSFKDGVKHGEGCEWLANGDWIAGNFVNGEHDKQQEIHKAVEAGDEDPELPDDMQAALQPLALDKLRKLRSAADGSDDDSGLESDGEENNKDQNGKEGASPFSAALAVQKNVFLSEKDLENWQKVKTIGKGSFGAVFEALLANQRTVCVKVVELGSIVEKEELEKLHNEIALMKRMQHPNIVQYYGSLQDTSKNTINIFMELVTGGSLNSVIKKFKTIPRKTLQQWTYQIVLGVKYLHECGIVHRDIKGDNVLVTPDGIIKLADFGCSKSIDDVCSATHGCSTMVGTPYWMAPEVIKCEGGYGAKSDIWSIGCTIVEMLTGRPPWPECNSMWAAVYKIANSTGLPTEIPKDIDPQLMNLLEKCFERDPRKRPTAAQMLEHPFLAGVMDE
ncbi:protein kinase [Angomonas deanei]|uniref:MORN repeat/Protein kinase domain/Protein tyrosine kinase/Fungal protein kinase, putative n=1 Tax=Angomonas deanei TaxID=59799 RepID=A0A7G2CVY3_9TRYP|nr:protein kinase [Angomonas deanei]CAD2222482.1 MORN repeat/Protein kinase domain/Protein tyrosine kinase/Fungal protein kinase, putative [Angomonas deanei]|eukprot:EPY28820.1 protein kinase [Angomonas deanei]